MPPIRAPRAAFIPRAPASHAGACRRLMHCVGAALLVAGLGACSSNDPNRSGLLEPYRVGLPQGNYVTREQVEAVKSGMTRDQVRFILGSPLLNPMFKTDRWDYVYRYQHPSGRAESRRVTVRFQDERVATVQADALPDKEDANDPALPGYRPPGVAQGSTR